MTALWIAEFLYWIFALACFLGIVGTLAAFDGHKVPEWRGGITLNTIVSLLAAFATFSLVVPITSGLGQSKWLWLLKPRHLDDFEAIESARNGPAGSVRLLLRGKGGYVNPTVDARYN
jgi:hypothetical protein